MALRRFAVAALLAAGCASPPPIATPTLRSLDWHPDLDQPLRQLHEVLDATGKQQEMNYTAANLAFVMDAKLYLCFEQYLQAMPVDQRNAAIETQRRWLKTRAEATRQAYAEYEGGTLASFSGSQAFIKLTQDRIAEVTRGTTAATTSPMR